SRPPWASCYGRFRRGTQRWKTTRDRKPSKPDKPGRARMASTWEGRSAFLTAKKWFGSGMKSICPGRRFRAELGLELAPWFGHTMTATADFEMNFEIAPFPGLLGRCSGIALVRQARTEDLLYAVRLLTKVRPLWRSACLK